MGRRMVQGPSTRRVYQAMFEEHLEQHRQMVFVAGPRQVGKTTVCRALASEGGYFTWDDIDQRALILSGPNAVAAAVGGSKLSPERPRIVLDELHRFPRWKTFLKGLFDVHGDRLQILVTGSSRLDVYRRGGDSLMGRYLLYHMHPMSAAECVDSSAPQRELRAPAKIADADWSALLEHGGFPEPFFARQPRFTTRWRALRDQQLLREDVRDLTGIQELDRLEVLARLLLERSSTSVVYSSLARDVQVSVDTVRRWIGVLTHLHHGFLVRPWFKNVAKALRKEPRWFQFDWAAVPDPGRRNETLVGCHLYKAVQAWTDLGFGRFELYYVRDKLGREVDFVVVKDGQPWFLVEAKVSDEPLSKSLHHYHSILRTKHAFQCALHEPFVPVDCFSRNDPVAVPARTLLSQLV
jgi:predicted AAA+ superfamily ATPase